MFFLSDAISKPVALLEWAGGAIGFEIEELGDGTVAVFLPSVPAATLGQVQIVPQKRVTPLKATMHETLEALTMFGVGSSKLVDADPETNP